MLWNQDRVLFGPKDEKDLFRFLRSATQEFEFLNNARKLNLFEVSRSVLAGAELARDAAVEQWNRWMWRTAGREWFLIYRRAELDRDYEHGGFLLTAGSSVMLAHKCEAVLANVAGQGHEVRLECAVAPPSVCLKVLPVEEVVGFEIFNH